jgi:hypothetical protein
MSFSEFQIRLFAYQRMQLGEWEKIRFLGWCSTIGSHQDPKKLPKSIEKFLPLGNKPKTNINDEMKQRYLEAYSNYLKEKENGTIRN